MHLAGKGTSITSKATILSSCKMRIPSRGNTRSVHGMSRVRQPTNKQLVVKKLLNS